MTDQGGDCGPEDPAIHPDASEYCDEVDQDCDGQTNDADSIDAQSWPVDADGDGFGSETERIMACEMGPGMAELASDCNDTDAGIFPGAPDDADDGVDANCDGVVPKTWISGGGSGCGCDANGGHGLAYGWLLSGLVALRRRRT
jgi:hypothetical protein